MDVVTLGAALGALATTQQRLQWWARSHRGVQDRYPAMASPPTMSVSANATSTINGTYTSGAVRYGISSGSLTVAHTRPVVSTAWRAGHINSTDGTVNPSNVPWSVRFITDAPVFEAAFIANSSTMLNIIVDGQYASRDGVNLPVLDNSGNARYVKFDFGTEVASFYLSHANIVSGGSGYAVGDIIVLAGGTGTTPAALKVTQVVGGVVGGVVAVSNPGVYSAITVTAGGLTQASTTGAGTGATFTGDTWSKRFTASKWRHIEIVMSGGSAGSFAFFGIVTGLLYQVNPWPISPRVPRVTVVGDSQNAGTYLLCGAGHMAASWAQMLGLWDGLSINGVGGTGIVTANGNAGPFSGAARIANVIADAPDIIVIDGSQNDAGQTAAALQAGLTAMISAFQAANPDVAIVILGPVVAPMAAWQAAAPAAAAAAARPSRIRVIDGVAQGWFVGNDSGTVMAPAGISNRDYYLTTGNHLTQAGVDGRAQIIAPQIGDALVSIVGQ